MFMNFAAAKTPGLDKFFIKFWNKELDQSMIAARAKKPTYKSASPRKTLNELVFDALGTTNNKDALVICDYNINSDKARVWKMVAPTEADKYQRAVDESISGASPSTEYLTSIRTVCFFFNKGTSALAMANSR